MWYWFWLGRCGLPVGFRFRSEAKQYFSNLSDSEVPAVIVPYLAAYQFDHLDFATFPQRHGYSKDLKSDIARPVDDLLAFAQSWLFFGLIEVFLGSPVDKNRLITYSNKMGVESAVLNMELVSRLLRTNTFWSLRVADYRTPVNLNITRITQALMTAEHAVSTLENLEEDREDVLAVILSIRLLIIHLHDYLANMDLPTSKRWQEALVRVNAVPASSSYTNYHQLQASVRLLVRRMQQAGWCPHQIHQMCLNTQYEEIYHLSSLLRTEPYEISHAKCSEVRCVAYDTNNETYQVRHTRAGCSCEMVEAPTEEVASIVRNGGVPLVLLPSPWNRNQNLRVVRHNGSIRYTAISHMWVDGLGNPSANALPRCQLHRLYRLVDKSYHPWWLRNPLFWLTGGAKVTSLWMDTLCIPVGVAESDQDSLRMQAIHRMALVYAGAKRVLVLDAELDQLNFNKKIAEYRIAHSRWNTRCWTLQEGCLAFWVYFGFRDRVYYHGLLTSGTLARVRNSMRSDKLHEKFVVAWNSLGERSTTKPEDMHVILANLTDFKAADIVSLPTAITRTKRLLDSIDSIPFDMLCNACPRPEAAANHAYRWIPSSPGPEPVTGDVLLHYTSTGLRLDMYASTYQPKIFLVPAAMTASSFCFVTNIDECVRWLCIDAKLPANDQFSRTQGDTACLILQRNHVMVGRPGIRAYTGARFLVTGVIAKDDKTTYLLRYDCPILYTNRDTPPMTDLEVVQMPVLTAKSISAGDEIVIDYRADDEKCSRLTNRYGWHDGNNLIWLQIVYLSIELSAFVGFCILEVLHSSTVSRAMSMVLGMVVAVQAVFLAHSFRRNRGFKKWTATFTDDVGAENPRQKTPERQRRRRRRQNPSISLEELSLIRDRGSPSKRADVLYPT